MSNRKEVEIYKSVKLPALGADQITINRQLSDSLKLINNRIKTLQNRLRELEEAQKETFKYLTGSLSTGRTTPNSDGEVELKSGNNSIELKVEGNVIDMRVRNALNEFTSDTTPGAWTGHVRVRIQNQGLYWIPLCSSTSP
jgi:phage host-nuclease inhibitor protein Gam